jgi:dihydrofolate reductase
VAKLIYMAIASLDGYVADEDGNFEWAKPDQEVHAFVNDLERSIGTHLYGRRLYELMIGWETMHTVPGQTPETLDFAAIWQAAEKVVYSRTLETVSSARTRIERDFAPDAVRQMKAEADRDISIGGATLAGEAIRAGLVDELHLIVNPIVVGGGTPSLPDGVRWELDLLDERRFANGVVYVRYRASD